MSYIVKYECEESAAVYYLQGFRDEHTIEWDYIRSNAYVFHSYRFLVQELKKRGMTKYLDAFASQSPGDLKSKITIEKV